MHGFNQPNGAVFKPGDRVRRKGTDATGRIVEHKELVDKPDLQCVKLDGGWSMIFAVSDLEHILPGAPVQPVVASGGVVSNSSACDAARIDPPRLDQSIPSSRWEGHIGRQREAARTHGPQPGDEHKYSVGNTDWRQPLDARVRAKNNINVREPGQPSFTILAGSLGTVIAHGSGSLLYVRFDLGRTLAVFTNAVERDGSFKPPVHIDELYAAMHALMEGQRQATITLYKEPAKLVDAMVALQSKFQLFCLDNNLPIDFDVRETVRKEDAAAFAPAENGDLAPLSFGGLLWPRSRNSLNYYVLKQSGPSLSWHLYRGQAGSEFTIKTFLDLATAHAHIRTNGIALRSITPYRAYLP